MRRGVGLRGAAVLATATFATSLLLSVGASAKMAQEIRLALPAEAAVGSPAVVVARALPYVGADPRLSSGTPSVCVLSKALTGQLRAGTHLADLHFLAAGTCTIRASSEETPEYGAAEVRKSMTVVVPVKQRQTITLSVPTEASAGTFGVVSARSSSHEAVELASVTPSVCKMKPELSPPASGTVLFVTRGTCTILARASATFAVRRVGGRKTWIQSTATMARKSFRVAARRNTEPTVVMPQTV